MASMKNDIVEQLANYEHDRWARWQKHIFSKCIINKDGSMQIPKEFVNRWTKQINTNYNDLSEKEKESDRREAYRILDCIKNKDDYNE